MVEPRHQEPHAGVRSCQMPSQRGKRVRTMKASWIAKGLSSVASGGRDGVVAEACSNKAASKMGACPAVAHTVEAWLHEEYTQAEEAWGHGHTLQHQGLCGTASMGAAQH